MSLWIRFCEVEHEGLLLDIVYEARIGSPQHLGEQVQDRQTYRIIQTGTQTDRRIERDREGARATKSLALDFRLYRVFEEPLLQR